MTKNLFLIGMPGSGKTTLAPLVAAQLGMSFRDTDLEIEAAAGLRVPEIFRREGEPGFRARETAVLKQLCKKPGLVIATGGGCVTREENYYYLRQSGVIILLERELSRLETEGRPLLLEADVRQLYEKRRLMYRRFAHRTIENNADIPAAVQAIVEAYHAAIGD